MHDMLHAFPEKSQWDLLVEHELGEWFSCQWVDTEDVDEIARRLRVDPDSGTPCDFETAMRSYETDPNTLIVWVGEHSPGWSTVLTLSGVTVPPKAMEALSAGRRRVLEAFFVEVADPGKLLYTRDGEYIGEVFPPSSRGGWTEVPEFEAYTSGLELHGAMSDAEVFDRCLCMMGRITGRFVDREWFTSIRTLYRIPEGTWEESR